MNYLYSDIMSGELDRINPTIVEGAEGLAEIGLGLGKQIEDLLTGRSS